MPFRQFSSSAAWRALVSPTWADEHLLAYWWAEQPSNWGDALNPWLLERLTGKTPVHCHAVPNIWRRPVVVGIGSILGHDLPPRSIVWGSGLLSADQPLRATLADVRAVRGPLTRAALLKQGVACPPVYGDPALLYPRIYHPVVPQRYRLGLVPHYVDLEHPHVQRLAVQPDVLLVDVRQPIDTFVDQLLSCASIASSSLHGLIAADAYGLPSTWLTVSNKVLGGEFKFQDFFLSTGRQERRPLRVGSATTIEDILSHAAPARLDLDLDALLAVAPFEVSRNRRPEML